MNKVQIYEIFMIMFALFFAGLMDGKERLDKYHHWYDFFIALPFSLPIVGRIFGWW